MPDAAELELIAHELRDALGGDPGGEAPVPATVHFRGRGTLIVDAARIRDVLRSLHTRGYRFMASLYGVDYYPDEPRLGVLYELLDMERVDRITVKLRVPCDAPEVDSVTGEWPTANRLVIGAARRTATFVWHPVVAVIVGVSGQTTSIGEHQQWVDDGWRHQLGNNRASSLPVSEKNRIEA